MEVLRTRMLEEMRLRNFAPTTQKAYLYAVTKLAQYYKRPPDQLDKEEIRSYLLYLTTERKLSPNTMTMLISGLRFFYNETLGWDETKLFIPRPNLTAVTVTIYARIQDKTYTFNCILASLTTLSPVILVS